jgi:betaine-aldehyde dehydrogenase
VEVRECARIAGCSSAASESSSSGSATVEVVSPATEEVIGVVPEGTFADVDAAVAAARAAFDDGEWVSLGAPGRAEILEQFSGALHDRQDEIAHVVTEEVGRPLSVSTVVQATVPLMFLDHYIGLARTYPFEELRAAPMGSSLVLKEPVGVTAAIVPWDAA